MRQMMEGVVLFGTGKEAQLNGYSSGGKTGTAQKIDPKTHTYSKTMHVASFAGFAPVNNPVISVAVIIDTPKGQYYGASVSAPVFAEVAQQVLEYLGVPHDIDLKPASTTAKKKEAPVSEDEASAPQEDIQALYQAANDLPSDDPENPATSQAQDAAVATAMQAAGKTTDVRSSSPSPQVPVAAQQSVAPNAGSDAQTATVQLPDGKKLRVPSLVGLPVRDVIERAGEAGLEVQISGNGTSREQAPAAGTMVAPGTKIVVRCAR